MITFARVTKIVFATAFLFVTGCSFSNAQQPIDKKATYQTKALYKNLFAIEDRGVMFGHQEDLAYGVGWNGVAGRSDVKDVCGDYPAIQGWDVGKEGADRNIDHVLFSDVKRWIRETYDRGGINTLSWHVDNSSSGGQAWDTTKTVKHILPGGKDHDKFKARLDQVAKFLNDCKAGDTYIPVIFRPWHEHNGKWFWWGKGNCTEQEYIALWRFTVDYLKKEKNIHHVLYAFSPDRSGLDMRDIKGSYLYGYPGDDYVDILGYDDYMDVGISWNRKTKDEQQADLILGLTTISQLAKEKNKVAAITETGLESLQNPTWFTDVILNPLKNNPAIRMSYVMVWRNANDKHHYAPYPNHAAADNFVQFYKDDLTLFESDLHDVYKSNK